MGGIKLGSFRLRKEWRCAQQHLYVKALLCRPCRISFHVWRDVQRIDQHYQQEFQWSLRGWCHCGQRELESRYFLLITCFATTMHLAPRFCCFGRGRWHGWNPWKVAKIRNPRWCVGIACCLVVEVQLGHAGAQARGDLETAAAKNKDMKESGIHVPESYFSKIFFQPWSVSCTALQNLGHRQ